MRFARSRMLDPSSTMLCSISDSRTSASFPVVYARQSCRPVAGQVVDQSLGTEQAAAQPQVRPAALLHRRHGDHVHLSLSWAGALAPGELGARLSELLSEVSDTLADRIARSPVPMTA